MSRSISYRKQLNSGYGGLVTYVQCWCAGRRRGWLKRIASVSLNNMWKWCGICCAVGLSSDRHYPLTQTSLSVAEDMHNWCQGPINQPVSKRPCNAFWISAYVESEPVFQQAEPLRGAGAEFSGTVPALMRNICGRPHGALPALILSSAVSQMRGAQCWQPSFDSVLKCLYKQRGDISRLSSEFNMMKI